MRSALDTHSKELHDAEADEFIHLIQDRLSDYELVLKGARAVATLRGGADKAFWRAYVERLELQRQYPGVLGISYVPLVAANGRAGFLKRLREEQRPDFAIWPQPQGGSAPVAYMEPMDADNQKVIGFDLFSEQMRRQTLEHAAETGLTSISGQLELVQDRGQRESHGFLMCMPVYAKDAPVFTPAEKRRALIGFVTSAFRMRDFMNSLEGRTPRDASFTLYDGGRPDEERLYFASTNQRRLREKGYAVESTRTFEVFGRSWTLHIRSIHHADTLLERHAASLVLVAGLAISLLTALVLLSLRRTVSRAEKIALGMTEALRESEEQKRLLFDNAPLGIFQTTPEGRFLNANPYLAKLYGYGSPQELMTSVTDIGRQLYANPEDRDRVLRELEKGPIVRLESCRVHKDGTQFWVAMSALGVRDERGRLIRVDGFSRDVTDRVLAERALEAERLRLANIIEGTNAGTWEWNVQTGEAMFNERWARITGHSREDLARASVASWRDLTHPDDADAKEQALQRHFRGETDSYDFKCRIRHKDGRWIWVHVCGRVVSWTEDRKPLVMSGILFDITESRRTIEALRESEERYRAFFSSAESMRLISDPSDNGRIVDANEAAVQFYGYGQALKGMFIHDLNTLPREQVAEDIAKAAAKDRNLFHFRHRLASGEIRDVEVHISHIHADGKSLLASSVHDVTELRRLERVREDVEAIMRHDLKAPLSAFVTLPKLMSEDESLSPEHRNSLLVLHHTATRMLQHINATLALQKIEAGGYQPAVDQCGPVQTLRGNIELLAVCRNMRRDRVRIDPAEDTFVLHTDPLLLDVAVMNILSNALEAGEPDEPVRVEVQLEGGVAAISVWNPGPVPQDMRDRFFEKYATSGKVGGTGIGTYSVSIMARAMGGSVEMRTSDTDGTTVTLRIPDRTPPEV